MEKKNELWAWVEAENGHFRFSAFGEFEQQLQTFSDEHDGVMIVKVELQ